jgi:hypothetical protein
MSEPIPESVPTSADPRSGRPVKRVRASGPGTATALASQAHEIETLFLDPTRPVNLPPPTSALTKHIQAPPEIVANVQGSSAGAGSGEFHVYKASRRREYERLRVMDEEAKKEEEDEKWARQERERRERDEAKTKKNREKRNKRKAGGGNKPRDQSKGPEQDGTEKTGETIADKKKPLPMPRRGSRDDDQGTDFGVAEVVKEVGITIHDDD